MGTLTRAVEGLFKRNIIPMGRPQETREYSKKAKFSEVVRDAGMEPHRVDVVADGDDVDVNDKLGDCEDITLMPKQKGGFDLLEALSPILLGAILDPENEDKELWDKIEKRVV